MEVKTGELRNQLSRYLKRVRRVRQTGDPITVFDRNRPVGGLVQALISGLFFTHPKGSGSTQRNRGINPLATMGDEFTRFVDAPGRALQADWPSCFRLPTATGPGSLSRDAAYVRTPAQKEKAAPGQSGRRLKCALLRELYRLASATTTAEHDATQRQQAADQGKATRLGDDAEAV